MQTLKGITVLDLTQAYSGPFCTCQMADFGADVIKVEPPEFGDQTRSWLPFKNGASLYFAFVNRNKKSVTINLKSEKGRKIFLDLARSADVVIENFRPGTAKKLGIDYQAVKEVNPAIIYASISGFGQYGPESTRASYAMIAEAMSGHMDLTGYPDGPPTKTGLSMADTFTGMFALYGIMLALYQRDKTGIGQYIDIAMVDALFSATECAAITQSVFKSNPTRMGNRENFGAPYDCFKASDGFYVMGVATDPSWEGLCSILPVLREPRFSSMELRKKNEEELTHIINDYSSNKTRAELEVIMLGAGIPYAPVLSIGEALENEQLKARDMIKEIDMPKIGRVTIPGVPLKMTESEGYIKTGAPELGEHNAEILSSLNLSEAEIRELEQEGVL